METATVTISVKDVEPITALLAKAADVVDAAADLLTVLSEREVWPHEAALLRDKMGDFRVTMSQLNGN